VRERGKTTTDPHTLGDLIVTANMTATPPTPAAGWYLDETDALTLANGDILSIYTQRRSDAKTRIEWEGSIAAIDPDGVHSSQIVVTVEDNATEAWGAAPFVGAQKATYRTRRLNSGKYQHAEVWDVATSHQRLARAKARKLIDPDGLESTATVAAVGAVTVGDDGSLELVSTETRYTENGAAETITHYGVEGNKARILREATRETLAVDNIGSEATTAAIDGAPAAHATLLKSGQTTKTLADASILKIDTHDVWGSPLNAMIAKGSHAAGGPVETAGSDVLTHLASASSDIVVAETYRAALQADPAFERVTVRTIKPGLKEIVVTKATDDGSFVMEFGEGMETMRTAGGLVQVGWIKQRTADSWYTIINPVDMRRVRGTIRLRRLIAAATMTNAWLHYELVGLTNNATLFGWGANSVMYDGPQIVGNLLVSGSRKWVVDYRFKFDSFLHLDESQVVLGRVTKFGGSAPTIGLNSPGGFGWTITFPNEGNMSVFEGTLPTPP
jgi:hypothetical protein